MWYVHFSLDLDLVACCVDWQRPQVVRLQMSIVMKRVPFVEMTLLKSILATRISTVGVATLPG